MSQLFIEKYRPSNRNEIFGNKIELDRLFSIVKNGNIPHCLFEGYPGVGKTTTAIAIAKTMFGEYYKTNWREFNASDERGIDIVKGEMKDFCRTSPLGSTFKILFLDEADGLCLPEGTEIITGNVKKTLKKIEDFSETKKCIMPSVNLQTGKIESDYGILVDSGYVDFYELTLEDGRKIVASPNHPFFILENGVLKEKKLKDIDLDKDEIVDVSDEIYNTCLECNSLTFNKKTCSIKCQNKHHSKEISGKNNPSYGKKYDGTIFYRRHLPKTEYINCENCNKQIKTKGKTENSVYVHHIDSNRNNNKKENLKFLCPKCHSNLHRGKKVN